MVGKTIHYCNRCDYKSNRRPNVNRHFSKMHQNLSFSPGYVEGKSQEFPFQQPSPIPLQPSLPCINLQPAGAGQREVSYSDEDTNSEYSSPRKQHDFLDSDSDSSESHTEPGEATLDSIDELEDALDNIIEVRKKFRDSLGEMKLADTNMKKEIFKKIAALKVKIIDEGVGIEEDHKEDADESEDELEKDESDEVEEEEGDSLNEDNPFNVLDEIKHVINEEDKEILDKAMEKATKKRMEEKQDEIDEDESDDESDNESGLTEKVFKQDKEKLRQCIDGVECEGCEYFEHCSNDKIDTIYRWCKHILNNQEKYDAKNIEKVKVKWMPIRFHVRKLADPEQSLEAKRKVLQKASVGDGVLSGLAKLALPMVNTFLEMMRNRD